MPRERRERQPGSETIASADNEAIPKASQRPEHQQRVVKTWQAERARLEDWSEEHWDWLAGDVEARNELRV
jgi:hypothetical protein